MPLSPPEDDYGISSARLWIDLLYEFSHIPCILLCLVPFAGIEGGSTEQLQEVLDGGPILLLIESHGLNAPRFPILSALGSWKTSSSCCYE